MSWRTRIAGGTLRGLRDSIRRSPRQVGPSMPPAQPPQNIAIQNLARDPLAPPVRPTPSPSLDPSVMRQNLARDPFGPPGRVPGSGNLPPLRGVGGVASEAAEEAARRGSLLLGRSGGGLRQALSKANTALRGSRGGLLGLGALGVGGSAIYGSDRVQDAMDRARGYEDFGLNVDPSVFDPAAEGRDYMRDFDASQQVYMDALNQVLSGGDFDERQRQMAADLQAGMAGWGGARAQGIEQAYSGLAEDQAASVEAIERIAGLAEDVFGEDNEATRAAVMQELYGGPATEASGLVPISGAMADMPGQMAAEGDISAREALAAIMGESSGARFGAETAGRYGQAYADQLRDQIAMEMFGVQQQSQAAINAEAARRQRVREEAMLGMADTRADFDLQMRQQASDAQRARQMVLAAVQADPGTLRRYNRDWNKALQNDRERSRLEAQGITNFEEFAYRTFLRENPGAMAGQMPMGG